MAMRRIAVVLSFALGSLTAACADRESLGPSELVQVDDLTTAAAKGDDAGTTGGGKKVGGSAGGVKGKGR